MWGAWGKAFVIGGIGAYTAFLVHNIHKNTSSPSCSADTVNCASPAVSADQEFYLNVFVTNFHGSQLRYDETILLPDTRGKLSPILAPSKPNNSAKSIHVGTIRSSMNLQSDCLDDKVVKGTGVTKTDNSPLLTRLWKGWTCKTHLDWQVPDDWRSNNTNVWVFLTATLIDEPRRMAFTPIAAPISAVYRPERKARVNRRFLLSSTDETEARPLFEGGDSYMAVPPRIAIGPLGISKPLDMKRMARSGMGHWVHSEGGGKYKVSLMTNTYISPRDEHYPLERPLHDTEKFKASFVPTTHFELATTSYRAAAIQALMKPALLQMETAFGTSQYDSDSIMLLIVGESPMVLLVTFTISMLHLVFEFLAMSSSWNHMNDMANNPSLNKSLSRRAIILEIIFEIAILAWLWDEGEAKIIQFVMASRIAFNVWKVFKLGKPLGARMGKEKIVMPARSFTERLRSLSIEDLKNNRAKMSAQDFESDCLKTMAIFLIPVLVGIALYQVIYEPHKNWLSWFLKTSALFSYMGGFVAMTPQLFTNYYYRTVESLSWTTLIYQFLNTIIDDVFAFVIRMPKAHRLSVFRDDIILVIYYLQKRHYKTDKENDDPKKKLKEN